MDSQEAVEANCPDGNAVVLKAASESGCSVSVSRAPGHKCDRCWYHCTSVGSHDDHPALCSRCNGIVVGLGLPPPPPAADDDDEKEGVEAGAAAAVASSS